MSKLKTLEVYTVREGNWAVAANAEYYHLVDEMSNIVARLIAKTLKPDPENLKEFYNYIANLVDQWVNDDMGFDKALNLKPGTWKKLKRILEK